MDGETLEGIEWRLTHHLGAEGELVPIVEEVTATATFIDGSVAGSTGCGRYHAQCHVDEDRLAVEAIAMTMMACDPRAERRRTRLHGPRSRLPSRTSLTADQLDLADANGRVVLRLRAVGAIA